MFVQIARARPKYRETLAIFFVRILVVKDFVFDRYDFNGVFNVYGFKIGRTFAKSSPRRVVILASIQVYTLKIEIS